MSTPAEQTPGWPELVRVVDANNGAYKTTMLALRTVHGSARISERIGEEISTELNARGLGHFPDPLPIRQEDGVTLYRKGSLGAEVFGLMHNSAQNGAQEALARAIRLINEASANASEGAMRLFEDMSQPKKRRRRRRNPGSGGGSTLYTDLPEVAPAETPRQDNDDLSP